MIYFVFFTVSCLLIWRIDEKNISIICTKKHRYVNGYLILAATLIPCMLAGARADTVGADVQTYVLSCFERASKYKSFGQLMNEHYLEVLYETLAFVVSRFFSDVHWMHFISSAIIVIGFCELAMQFKNKIPIELVMMAFYCFYFCQSLNTVRQWIAISISCIAGKYLIKQQPVQYFLLATVAVGFHSSAVILYFVYFIYRFARVKERTNSVLCRPMSMSKNRTADSRKKLLVTVFFAIIVAVLFNPILRAVVYIGILPTKYLNYLVNSDGQASIIMIILQKSPFVIGIGMLWKELIRYDERNQPVIVFTLIDCILGLLSSKYGYASRITLYFAVWEMILIGQFYSVIKIKLRKANTVVFLNVCFYGLLATYWYYCYIYRGFSMAYPYVSDVIKIFNWYW